jgi:hypothetical protein
LTTTGLLVVYAKCIRAPAEADWDAWEDRIHVPALCTGDGPWAATRFEVTARPEPGMPGLGFTHVTIYELDAPDVLAQAERALDRDTELRGAGRMHPAHVTTAADTFTAHGPFGYKPEPSPARRGHILAHVLCNDPTREAEWDDWYDEQHAPDMLASGAFAALSRWRRTRPAPVGPNHLTLYDVSTDTVDEAVRRSATTLAEIVAAGRKHETHAGALTVVLRPTGAYSASGFRRERS